jgi:hypothetical protein
MRQVSVRYRVKPERVAENEELVRAVYEELGRVRPDGLAYATFKLEDGVSFVHLARTTGDGNPLTGLDAFKAFQQGIPERCDEQPVFTEFETIGAYRAFDD